MRNDLMITGAAVREGGRLRARLTYSGRRAALALVTAPDGRRLGRILPAGFTTGQWDPAAPSGLFEPWTAKHPHVHVPSDEITGQPMPWEQCVAFIIGGNP
jgi:hypothetical protein